MDERTRPSLSARLSAQCKQRGLMPDLDQCDLDQNGLDQNGLDQNGMGQNGEERVVCNNFSHSITRISHGCGGDPVSCRGRRIGVDDAVRAGGQQEILEADAMLVTTSPAVADYARRTSDAEASTGLAGDAVALRLMSAGVKRLEAREHLFCEGDPAAHVYRIDAGYVCIYKMMPDGRRQVVDFGYPGDLIGLGAGAEHSTSAHALGVCRVRAVPSAALHQMARQDAKLALSLYDTLAHELEAARGLLLSCCQH
ncbi:MAG: cyclic nucleotide-binding domain-containing protein, partial [Hyphomicrobium sp.]